MKNAVISAEHTVKLGKLVYYKAYWNLSYVFHL